MEYEFRTDVRDNEKLRESFNELTRKTFCFDFKEWYETGYWGKEYIPHVLVDNGKVISNVSVNLMRFKTPEGIKNYIQLGTVMTDEQYRGKGVNRYIMERILEEYQDRKEGIYLFGNDDVLDYYPKFGFKPADEYEYVCTIRKTSSTDKYTLMQIDPWDTIWQKRLDECMKEQDAMEGCHNNAFRMCNNTGLYRFWLNAVFGDKVYFIPENEAFVIAEAVNNILEIHEIFGKKSVDISLLAETFREKTSVTDIRLHYTPTNCDGYEIQRHKEEDGTLFILGGDLHNKMKDKIMFPEMSHA